MKILVVSDTAWADDNSFGNSFSNIFQGLDDLEFANVYCRYGSPNNSIRARYFQITEKMLLKNRLNSKFSPGREVVSFNDGDELKGKQVSLLSHIRTRRFTIYYWLRALIWKIGRWNSPALRRFIDDFSPDIIFQPIYYSLYLNDIVLALKKQANAPMVGYISDDNYTLRQFSLSPLYWLNRFMIRPKVRRVIRECELLYVISEIQKKEYEKIFGKECRVLTKGKDFSGLPPLKNQHNAPLKFVYTGNIGAGRWCMLSLIGLALRKINAGGLKAVFYIYTTTPLSSEMKAGLPCGKSVIIPGAVTADKIPEIQSDADILVHVESFALRERLQVHQSFSTKLVDYFYAARCIFAVGTPDMASIDHLVKNDAGVVASNARQTEVRLRELVDNPDLIDKYAKNAWECGRRNHQITRIQEMLLNDLHSIADNKHENPADKRG